MEQFKQSIDEHFKEKMMIKVAELSTLDRYFRWEYITKPNFNFEYWVKEKQYIYDADSSGDDTSYWVVMIDGETKYYSVYHEWYWYHYGQEDSHLENEFTITEITKEGVTEKYAKENLKFLV